MSNLISTRQAYSEIDTFLDLLDEYNRNKIPKELRDFFKKEKDRNYSKNINPNKPIKEQNLKEETLALIALLNLKYWCEDEREKQKLIRIYEENDRKHQIELKKRFNSDNIFRDKEKIAKTQSFEQNSLIELKEDSFFKKIMKLIKVILKIDN